MNRILIIIICLTCLGCTSQAKNQNTKSDVNFEEFIANFKSLESNHNKLSAEINDLSNKVDSLQNENKILENKIADKNDDLSRTEYILYIVIFIWLLAITIIGLVNNNTVNKETKIVRRDYNDLKRAIDFYVHSLKEKINNKVSNENVSLLESRVAKIETKLKSCTNFNLVSENSSQNSKRPRDLSKKSNILKEAYFGMVKGNGFFNDIYTVNKDESLFKITYLNDNQVSFVPVDLQKIRFIDDIEKAVHFIGETSLKNATSFVIQSEGYAVKNGDVWEIKDKVEILLK